VKTFPSETYFFMADFAPLNAQDIADRLQAQGILIKALNDPALGPGFMRVTTALPPDNALFLAALRDLLPPGYVHSRTHSFHHSTPERHLP
jgi:histidinol-phosphate aminotransferase